MQEQNLLLADITAHEQVGQAQKAYRRGRRPRGSPGAWRHLPGGPRPAVHRRHQPHAAERRNGGQPRPIPGGFALAGLGASFMAAENTYHVSARYFVAHAILESGWGTSAIAQNKHNLFGFGANDANPYGDANSFPSFDACIQFVAQFVRDPLSDGGRPYYHGPTLRGMNVDYASDPNWATKIASIADTIPPLAGT